LVKDVTGGYAAGLAIVAALFAGGGLVLLELGMRWSGQWAPDAVREAGIFMYRATVRIAGDERAA
jgi:hypothetical protein